MLAQTEPPQPDAHVQAAIEASTRAEANLSSLLRAIQEASSGVSGVREANDRLAAELRRVREILSVVNERRMMLERRIAMLEDDRERSLREVDQARLDATRDRAFLVEEQDRFLSSMLEDHEKAIAALRRERDDAREKAVRMTSGLLGIERRSTNPDLPAAGSDDPESLRQNLLDSKRTIDKLAVERERARDVLRRLQAQRDEAQEDADRLHEELDRVRAEFENARAERAFVFRTDAPPGQRVNQDARKTDPVAPLDRPTNPIPQPAFEAALAASRSHTPTAAPSRSPVVLPATAALSREQQRTNTLQGAGPVMPSNAPGHAGTRTAPQVFRVASAAQPGSGAAQAPGASGPAAAPPSAASKASAAAPGAKAAEMSASKAPTPPFGAQALAPPFSLPKARLAATPATKTTDPMNFAPKLPPLVLPQGSREGPPRRPSPLPAELAAAIFDSGAPAKPAPAPAEAAAEDEWEQASAGSSAPPPKQQPPLKSKPNPVSGSLGGYSVGGEELQPERVEQLGQSSTRLPRR